MSTEAQKPQPETNKIAKKPTPKTSPAREKPTAQEATQVDLEDRMRMRLKMHQMKMERMVRNPTIPNNPFDLWDSGLPRSFEYHPVPVPKPESPFYMQDDALLTEYRKFGFQFLMIEDVTDSSGVSDRGYIPSFEEKDGKVVIGGCYILFADKDWYTSRRLENIAERNAILESKTNQPAKTLEESSEQAGFKVDQTVESKRQGPRHLSDLMVEEKEVDPRVFE